MSPLIKIYVLHFFCVHMGAYATCCPFQTLQHGFVPGWCICQKRYVINVVRVGNSLCGSIVCFSLFPRVKPLPFIKSIDVRNTYSRQIMNRYGSNMSLCRTLATMSKRFVSPLLWFDICTCMHLYTDNCAHTKTHTGYVISWVSYLSNQSLLYKKLKKRLHILEADIITIKKRHWFDVSSSKDAFFTERVPNDRHYACLGNKSWSY